MTLSKAASRLFKREEIVKSTSTVYVHRSQNEFDERFVIGVIPLGVGAHGKVYRAWDIKEKCVIAIKRSDKNFDSMYDTLPHEFDLLSSIPRHPNILSPYSLHYTPRYTTIVMPLAGPSTLDSLAPMTEDVLKPLIYQLLGAMNFLHTNGISHNDIKPPNVLVDIDPLAQKRWLNINPIRGKQITINDRTLQLQNARIRLCDFGLADKYELKKNDGEKHDESQPLWTTYCSGTPAFLSVERFNLERHDARKSDVFAFGVTIIETLIDKQVFIESPPTGARWYIGERSDATHEDLEKAHKFISERKSSKWVAKILGKVSPEMLEFLINCLAFDPKKRPLASTAMNHVLFDDIVNAPRRKHRIALGDITSRFNTLQKPRSIDNLRDFKTEMNNLLGKHLPSPSKEQRIKRRKVMYLGPLDLGSTLSDELSNLCL